ncbi:hypothetical protein [Streptomyces sp. NPDC006140]|uniref:hypothetical protein n=1 Tax=Streptomyces sp. NPDC006140 TaxID=3154579 RepID=UPI0034036172
MRRFLSPERLWALLDAPQEDRILPHVLWLPDQEVRVLNYFARVREILNRYPELITPVATPALQHELSGLAPTRPASSSFPAPRAASASAPSPTSPA